MNKNMTLGKVSTAPTVAEYDERIVFVNRVSKKTTGGNKLGFNVLIVVGDHNGKVGVGLGKARDVHGAAKKASARAKKRMIRVEVTKSHTIPHEIEVKLGAARVFLKPAMEGTGVIAGGSVRAVVEAAGIQNILTKVLGTNNKLSNVYATLKALSLLKNAREFAHLNRQKGS